MTAPHPLDMPIDTLQHLHPALTAAHTAAYWPATANTPVASHIGATRKTAAANTLPQPGDRHALARYQQALELIDAVAADAAHLTDLAAPALAGRHVPPPPHIAHNRAAAVAQALADVRRSHPDPPVATCNRIAAHTADLVTALERAVGKGKQLCRDRDTRPLCHVVAGADGLCSTCRNARYHTRRTRQTGGDT